MSLADPNLHQMLAMHAEQQLQAQAQAQAQAQQHSESLADKLRAQLHATVATASFAAPYEDQLTFGPASPHLHPTIRHPRD